MSATPARETIAPSSLTTSEIAQITRFLAETPDGEGRTAPYIAGPHGEKHEVPAKVYEALIYIMDALTKGHGVTVMPTDAQLTTQKAADYLQMSRPTLVKLLEAGDIAFTRVGRHRRVLLADLQDYEARLTADRQRFLAEQTREAVQNDDYFAMPTDHETR